MPEKDRQIRQLLKDDRGNIVYVDSDKDASTSSWRVFVGKPGEMKEAPVKDVSHSGSPYMSYTNFTEITLRDGRLITIPLLDKSKEEIAETKQLLSPKPGQSKEVREQNALILKNYLQESEPAINGIRLARAEKEGRDPDFIKSLKIPGTEGVIKDLDEQRAARTVMEKTAKQNAPINEKIRTVAPSGKTPDLNELLKGKTADELTQFQKDYRENPAAAMAALTGKTDKNNPQTPPVPAQQTPSAVKIGPPSAYMPESVLNMYKSVLATKPPEPPQRMPNLRDDIMSPDARDKFDKNMEKMKDIQNGGSPDIKEAMKNNPDLKNDPVGYLKKIQEAISKAPMAALESYKKTITPSGLECKGVENCRGVFNPAAQGQPTTPAPAPLQPQMDRGLSQTQPTVNEALKF